MKRLIPVLLLATLLLPAAGAAQEAVRQPEPASLRPVRVAKWALLLGGAGAAVYGLQQNQQADDAYAELERMCAAAPDTCRQRGPGGAYVDAGLEQQYQRVRDSDGRARSALIAGQAGLAASAVLFIIDLRNTRPPRNIPFEPSRLELGVGGDGGLRMTLRF